jgi:hypothetical protein
MPRAVKKIAHASSPSEDGGELYLCKRSFSSPLTARFYEAGQTYEPDEALVKMAGMPLLGWVEKVGD